MDKKKKILVNLIKILLIILMVHAFNLIMMPKYITENYDGRIVAEFYKEKECPDVIFLGSSTVYSATSPCVLYESYGITSYVLASSSQTSWNSYYMLKEALKYGKPQMVVMDIGFLNQIEEYAEEVSNRKLFDYMKTSPNKFEAIEVSKAAEESKWSYIFPVLRYHERYKDLTPDDFKYALYKPDVTYNGYIMNLNLSDSLEEVPVTLDTAEDYRLNAKNADYLQKIITLCKDEGIQIMLVKTPSYNAKWGVNFENDITSIAALNGINYIDFDLYQDKMNLNYLSDSPDNGGHLNLLGAEKYSFFLGSVIKDNYEIPDRRNDTKVDSVWKDKVTKYNNDKLERIAQFGR